MKGRVDRNYNKHIKWVKRVEQLSLNTRSTRSRLRVSGWGTALQQVKRDRKLQALVYDIGRCWKAMLGVWRDRPAMRVQLHLPPLDLAWTLACSYCSVSPLCRPVEPQTARGQPGKAGRGRGAEKGRGSSLSAELSRRTGGWSRFRWRTSPRPRCRESRTRFSYLRRSRDN